MTKKYNGIVLFGEMGSGKDTFAEILAELEPKFALYNIGYLCRELMKVAKVMPEWKDKDREIGQLSSVKLREIDVNILNYYTHAKALESDSVPIIVGGRTMDDCEYWKNQNYLVVGVNVDYDIRIKRIKDRDTHFNVGSLSHITELDVPRIIENLCDVVVDNNGDLDALYNTASLFLKDYSNIIIK